MSLFGEICRLAGKRKAPVRTGPRFNQSKPKEEATMLLEEVKSEQQRTSVNPCGSTPFRKRLAWWIKEGHEPVVTDVTPAMAEAMLEWNDRNRPFKRRYQQYANDMKAGRWVFNGDTITFSRERLIDGQHRLAAVVESGVSVRMILVFGAPDESFAFKDLPGSARRAADIFAINGVSNAVLAAAATTIVYAYDKGTMKSGLISNIRLPHDLLYAEFERYRDLERSFFVGHLFHSNRGVAPPAPMTALHYICARHHRGMADEFFRQLAEGADIKKTDPVYTLRKRLMEANLSPTTRLSRSALAALTIKAWNATRDGRSRVELRWNDDDSFPRAH